MISHTKTMIPVRSRREVVIIYPDKWEKHGKTGMYVFFKVVLLVEKPPFVDQNTWLLHSFPEFGKTWNDISKTDTYICKKKSSPHANFTGGES